MSDAFLDFRRDYDSPPRGFGAVAGARRLAVGATVAWVIAAVLAAVSAWQVVSRAELPGPDGSSGLRFTTDGWGRTHWAAFGTTAARTTQGGAPRYGIVVCLCAVVFLVCAGLAMRELVRLGLSRWPQRGLSALSIAAPALLVGLTWSVFLGTSTDSRGPFVWWCVSAAVCAIAAAVANAVDTSSTPVGVPGAFAAGIVPPR